VTAIGGEILERQHGDGQLDGRRSPRGPAVVAAGDGIGLRLDRLTCAAACLLKLLHRLLRRWIGWIDLGPRARVGQGALRLGG
jgi:hypothetical protein